MFYSQLIGLTFSFILLSIIILSSKFHDDKKNELNYGDLTIKVSSYLKSNNLKIIHIEKIKYIKRNWGSQYCFSYFDGKEDVFVYFRYSDFTYRMNHPFKITYDYNDEVRQLIKIVQIAKKSYSIQNNTCLNSNI